jgi:hypothetical protein
MIKDLLSEIYQQNPLKLSLALHQQIVNSRGFSGAILMHQQGPLIGFFLCHLACATLREQSCRSGLFWDFLVYQGVLPVYCVQMQVF